MELSIYQGSSNKLKGADIHIVIDVIRAFTVTHYAFLKGVKHIYLVRTVQEAFELKEKNPHYLLAGEVKGLPIEGFDLDNSPFHLIQNDLDGKILVQRTTNGVQATLNALNAKEVLVTGFTNAKTTANYILKKMENHKHLSINIIASHPTGDDDLACAEYIRDYLFGFNPNKDDVIERIIKSEAAKKFLDDSNERFHERDIDMCVREMDESFVMKVEKGSSIPMIERFSI